MQRGEWRAYNQPLATIQAPKQRITTTREAGMNRRDRKRDAILAAGDIAGERISIVTASPLSAEERAKLKGRPNRVDFSMK